MSPVGASLLGEHPDAVPIFRAKGILSCAIKLTEASRRLRVITVTVVGPGDILKNPCSTQNSCTDGPAYPAEGAGPQRPFGQQRKISCQDACGARFPGRKAA
jgi:hypothetical protein